MDPRPPSGWRGSFDGALGLWRLSQAACHRPEDWAGLSQALRHHRPWGRFGSAPRRPLPLLGTRGDRAPSWGAVLVVYNDVGDGLAAPRCLGFLGGL